MMIMMKKIFPYIRQKTNGPLGSELNSIDFSAEYGFSCERSLNSKIRI